MHRCASNLSHVESDIALLEPPLKRYKGELLVLPTVSYDNTSSELLDLSVVDGQVVNLTVNQTSRFETYSPIDAVDCLAN